MAVAWTNGDAMTFNATVSTGANKAEAPFPLTTVRTIDGYCGQITYGGLVVWQGKPRKTYQKAIKDARRKRNERLLALFAGGHA